MVSDNAAASRLSKEMRKDKEQKREKKRQIIDKLKE